MRPIPLLLAATCVCAVDAAAPADPTFEVRPGRLSMMRYRQWQQDGRRAHDNRDFEASIRFHAKGEVAVLGWKDLEIIEAISDAGEKLELSRNEGGREGRVDMDSRRSRDADDPEFEVTFDFAWPQKPCNGVARLQGRLTALIATGAPKKAVFKPYKDVAGKVMEIAGVAGGEVTVDRAENGQGVTLRYQNRLQEKIMNVSFQDGAGRDVRCNGWGGGSDGSEFERTYHVKLPDDGAIVIAIAPESRPVKVPFEISGLTMEAAPGKAARERVKVQAAEEAPAPAKPGETLPVKPVEAQSKF